MINNITFNNYQNRQNPSFLGKSFVQMKLFDETFLVPKAVEKIRRSDKFSLAEDANNTYCSNAVCMKDNIFLGISHFWKHFKKIEELSIGKINKGKGNQSSCSVNAVSKHRKNNNWDLGIFNVEIPKKWQIAKSSPVKLADRLPSTGEDIYIVAYHPDLTGPKVIPAKYTGSCKPSSFVDEEFGASSSYFQINSDILKNNLNTEGLSGCAIVNKKGELIGIQGKGTVNSSTNMSTGNLFGISIDTVKRYLKEVNISI